jgi:hypothetical protein
MLEDTGFQFFHTGRMMPGGKHSLVALWAHLEAQGHDDGLRRHKSYPLHLPTRHQILEAKLQLRVRIISLKDDLHFLNFSQIIIFSTYANIDRTHLKKD